MIDEVLINGHLTVVPVALQTHPLIVSPFLSSINGIKILSNWQNPHTGILTHRISSLLVRKSKWKQLKSPFCVC